MSVWNRDAWQLEFSVSAVVQSSQVTANRRTWEIGGYFTNEEVTSDRQHESCRRVLPYQDCLRSSVLLFSKQCQLQAHWESLDIKKENKKKVSIPVVYNMQIPEGDKNRQANKQKRISPKVMAFLLKSIESSTICSALADEHSCPFNCCRSLLPDAGWKEVLFLEGEESKYKLHVKTHLQASSGSIKPYSSPHFKQNWLRFCLDGDNYT